jgi:hypothetical protein
MVGTQCFPLLYSYLLAGIGTFIRGEHVAKRRGNLGRY